MSKRSARICKLYRSDGELHLELVNVHPETLGAPIESGWVVNGGWQLKRATDGATYEAWAFNGWYEQEPRTVGIDLSQYTVHDDGFQEEACEDDEDAICF